MQTQFRSYYGGRFRPSPDGARAAELDTGSVADGLDLLSVRERQVFHLLVLGYTNPEIARLLYVSVRTVESHRANLQRKLGLRTRAQLVALALKRGLLSQTQLLEP